MSDGRTEKPTPKRLEKAREEGQVARSRDLALAAASAASTIALAALGGGTIAGLCDRLVRDLAHAGDAPLRTVTEGELQLLLIDGARALAIIVGPIALVTMVAGAGMHGFQSGWAFAPRALRFHWSRLSPAAGVKRFGVMRAGADTVKTLVTVAALAYLGWLAVDELLGDMRALAWLPPAGGGVRLWLRVEQMLWRVAAVLAVLALGDYALQRYRLMSSLRMTRHEIRDELKEQEGSAEVKARVRRIQREMSRRRMMADVPRATVVIANPTHVAVALRYDRRTMAAPQVVARGQGHLALRIRELARRHGVPIVENQPLARMLFASAEVGETIPAALFNAVAEVLAYLIRLKQLTL